MGCLGGLAHRFKTIWKVLVLEIIPRLPQEQANTISKWNIIKFGFMDLVYGFGFKKFINKEEINIHKLIQNWIMQVG